jgi:hypothetical protein
VATEALPLSPISRARPAIPPSDRIFFGAMVLILWASVLWGFSPTYYAAGMIHAPLPNRIIHVHAIIMTLWMLLLFVQTALVAAGKVAWHRALGVYGFVLAIAVVIIGPIAATNSLRRGLAPTGLDPLTFYIVPLTAISLFAIFVLSAWRARRRPASHKRLILLANVAILAAAVGRWPVQFFQDHPPAMNLVFLAFVLALVAYDLISQHKVLKTTLWGSLLLLSVDVFRVPIGLTAPWHAFASFMLRHG